ncbi:uncharacterized protein VICG_00086 [Vittaforma corneae ATCC 50505]|uniref:60S acidic ribosomal protein P1 n=1 Tax=Vittaforma corneae (strain ATCC 50505) TaxID=993615 RepID=L2GPL1_VITCO|nr:uncharacterized protein VICG_00086 [Vittaforma corneae ATCC 50505]ELA42771.1 hypothetical protein VICG_00086 [Vittaforma corneae ATCC 50505]
MSDTINSTYPLAALLIHATKQEVTKEKMQAVFKTLGLDFSPKMASYFMLSADKYSSIISNIGGGSPAPSSNASVGSATTPAAETAPATEESSSDDVPLDF